MKSSFFDTILTLISFWILSALFGLGCFALYVLIGMNAIISNGLGYFFSAAAGSIFGMAYIVYLVIYKDVKWKKKTQKNQ